MKKIAVFASGSGSNAENIVNYFKGNDEIEVSFILCNKPDAGVLLRAERLGIPSYVYTNKVIREGNEVMNLLKEKGIILIVLAGYLNIIPQNIIDAFPERIVNIHPALLPKYGGKGMYGHFVHEAVVAAKDKESGITIHYVNEHYDEGKIFFQAKCKVLPDDTPADVERKVRELELRYFPEVIDDILKGCISPISACSGNPFIF
jgi:phosphoribosylglycinamide formyltransferase-1